MKVCISLRDPAPQNLHDGNLRSEGRWERQVIEACIQNPEVTDIYTAGYLWTGGDCVTSKYKGMISSQVSEQCILLIQDWNYSVISKYMYKAVLVNIFCGPWVEQTDQVNIIKQRYGKNLLFTIGYPSALSGQVDYLKAFVDPDQIQLLPVPAVSKVSEGSNFNKKILLWPYRMIFFSSFYKMPVIKWALEQILIDPTLKLVVATGWNRNEAKELNFSGTDAVNITEDLNDVFWSVSDHQKYIQHRNQVQILYSVPWSEMLNIYSDTKLMLPHATYNGGSPCEAAMNGVPFVGNGTGVTFKECPEFLIANTSDQHLSMLDRLLVDEEHYDYIGNSYRNYIKNTYTLEAFSTNLNNIIVSRGLT